MEPTTRMNHRRALADMSIEFVSDMKACGNDFYRDVCLASG